MSYFSGMSGYTGAISSAFNSVATLMSIREQNKAIEKQVDYNNKMLEARDNLNKFSQNNNINRANEAIMGLNADIEEKKRTLKVQAKQEISKAENVIASGITSGNSKARIIQNAYQNVSKELGNVELQGSNAIEQILENVRSDNERLQISKINDYNQTLINNSRLAGQAITGLNASLMVANSAISGFQKGSSFGSSIDNLFANQTKLDQNVRIDTGSTGNPFENASSLTPTSTGVGAIIQ